MRASVILLLLLGEAATATLLLALLLLLRCRQKWSSCSSHTVVPTAHLRRLVVPGALVHFSRLAGTKAGWFPMTRVLLVCAVNSMPSSTSMIIALPMSIPPLAPLHMHVSSMLNHTVSCFPSSELSLSPLAFKSFSFFFWHCQIGNINAETPPLPPLPFPFPFPTSNSIVWRKCCCRQLRVYEYHISDRTIK